MAIIDHSVLFSAENCNLAYDGGVVGGADAVIEMPGSILIAVVGLNGATSGASVGISGGIKGVLGAAGTGNAVTLSVGTIGGDLVAGVGAITAVDGSELQDASAVSTRTRPPILNNLRIEYFAVGCFPITKIDHHMKKGIRPCFLGRVCPSGRPQRTRPLRYQVAQGGSASPGRPV